AEIKLQGDRMKVGVLLIALCVGVGIYGARYLMARGEGGKSAGPDQPTQRIRYESFGEADDSDAAAALASLAEGFRAAEGASGIEDLQQRLEAQRNRPAFSRAAFEYGLRDGWLMAAIDAGAPELVGRLIAERDDWLALFGQEF